MLNRLCSSDLKLEPPNDLQMTESDIKSFLRHLGFFFEGGDAESSVLIRFSFVPINDLQPNQSDLNDLKT